MTHLLSRPYVIYQAIHSFPPAACPDGAADTVGLQHDQVLLAGEKGHFDVHTVKFSMSLASQLAVSVTSEPQSEMMLRQV